MKRIVALSLVLVGLMMPPAFAQQLYTHEKVEYSFELPSTTWRTILEPDATHEHPEFVFGDRLDGYLTIRKEVVETGTGPADVAQRDQDLTLRFLDRKSTRLNSSHSQISYAVFCLKKKKK